MAPASHGPCNHAPGHHWLWGRRKSMLRKHLLRQTFRFGACGVALLFYTTSGQSQDRSKAKGKETPATCSDAYKSALQMEESGRLQEARDTLLTCAKSACGNPLRQQCMDRYSRLDSDIP